MIRKLGRYSKKKKKVSKKGAGTMGQTKIQSLKQKQQHQKTVA